MNNTAISNFCCVGRMDILRERYGGRLIVTREVLNEARNGPDPRVVEWAMGEGWMRLGVIYADSPEYVTFVELRARGFGLGESSAIAACSASGTWVFISDDLDARNEAKRRGVGVVGTNGVLARHVAEGRLSLKEGNRLLRRMMDEGFRSHSGDLRL